VSNRSFEAAGKWPIVWPTGRWEKNTAYGASLFGGFMTPVQGHRPTHLCSHEKEESMNEILPRKYPMPITGYGARTTTAKINLGSGTNFDDALCCPSCGFNYLHHEKVTVFDRKEDALITTVTEVAKGIVTTGRQPSDRTRNPSSRRDGLAIQFWCEGCSYISELTIEQCKGATYLRWRTVGERIKSNCWGENFGKEE
jgi:hypothetical protein